jgi:hypothetical protein
LKGAVWTKLTLEMLHGMRGQFNIKLLFKLALAQVMVNTVGFKRKRLRLGVFLEDSCKTGHKNDSLFESNFTRLKNLLHTNVKFHFDPCSLENRGYCTLKVHFIQLLATIS